jgi:hypothetical protein
MLISARQKDSFIEAASRGYFRQSPNLKYWQNRWLSGAPISPDKAAGIDFWKQARIMNSIPKIKTLSSYQWSVLQVTRKAILFAQLIKSL